MNPLHLNKWTDLKKFEIDLVLVFTNLIQYETIKKILDVEFSEEYYREKFSGGGRADKSFRPSTAKELFDQINKTLILRSKLNPDEVKTIDLLLEKSFSAGKKDE